MAGCVAPPPPPSGQQSRLATAAGGGARHPVAATERILTPGSAAGAGDSVFVVDNETHQVFKIDTAGMATLYAGVGSRGEQPDLGTDRLLVNLPMIRDLALDASGNLYLALGSRVVKVTPAGALSTVAGTGADGHSGDGGPAIAAMIFADDIAIDPSGAIYIAGTLETGSGRVRRIDAAGTISTIAGSGSGTYSGDGGLATNATLAQTEDIAVGSAGVFVLDTGRVRLIANGNISRIAGSANWGFTPDGASADGANLLYARGIALDGAGRLHIADSANGRVRRVDANGRLETVAGTGSGAFSGDGGPAGAAAVGGPFAIQFDTLGRLLISTSGRIRRVDTNGIINTIAGQGNATTDMSRGDGGMALDASLNHPEGVAVAPDGRQFIADTWNGRIRVIDPSTSVITTYAGGGSSPLRNDVPATSARLYEPTSLALDTAGNLYFVDRGRAAVYRVDTAGTMTVVAGDTGYRAQWQLHDGTVAVETELTEPTAVAVDQSSVYISETGSSNRVRKVDAAGTITTFAGTQLPSAPTADGGLATATRLDRPGSLVVDATRARMLIAETGPGLVRAVSFEDGRISTVAGSRTAMTFGADGPATAVRINPRGLTMTSDGTLYISEFPVRLRAVRADGTITTVAGDVQAFRDATPANAGWLFMPEQLATGRNLIYIADSNNNRLRSFSPSP